MLEIKKSENIIKTYKDTQIVDEINFDENINFNYFVSASNSKLDLSFKTLWDNINWNIFVLLYGAWDTSGDILVEIGHSEVSINVFVFSLLQDNNTISVNWDIKLWKNITNTQWHLLEKNIVLGSNIKIKATPRLDVYSADVRATHWVSINKLIPEKLFYMMSKWLDYKSAVDLSLSGIIDFILDNYPDITDDEKSNIKNKILSTVVISND